jgi:tetratricopeptide (TPR) repeat protein
MTKYDQALIDFDRVIQLEEKNQLAILRRGLTYQRLGKYEQALADFDRAIQINDKNSSAITGRGQTYLFTEKYEQALADFDRAIQIDSGGDRPYYFRSLTYALCGLIEQSKRDIQWAVQIAQSQYGIKPRDYINFLNLALYKLSDGKYDEAQTNYQQAITPDFPSGYLLVAIWDLEDRLKLFPDDSRSALFLDMLMDHLVGNRK